MLERAADVDRDRQRLLDLESASEGRRPAAAARRRPAGSGLTMNGRPSSSPVSRPGTRGGALRACSIAAISRRARASAASPRPSGSNSATATCLPPRSSRARNDLLAPPAPEQGFERVAASQPGAAPSRATASGSAPGARGSRPARSPRRARRPPRLHCGRLEAHPTGVAKASAFAVLVTAAGHLIGIPNSPPRTARRRLAGIVCRRHDRDLLGSGADLRRFTFGGAGDLRRLRTAGMVLAGARGRVRGRCRGRRRPRPAAGRRHRRDAAGACALGAVSLLPLRRPYAPRGALAEGLRGRPGPRAGAGDPVRGQRPLGADRGRLQQRPRPAPGLERVAAQRLRPRARRRLPARAARPRGRRRRRFPKISLGQAFIGEIIAITILTGLTALAALRGLGPGRRTLAAALVAVPLPGRLLLTRRRRSRRPPRRCSCSPPRWRCRWSPRCRPGRRARMLSLAPLGVLAAGILFAYSFAGLAWPMAIAALWALTHARGAARRWRRAAVWRRLARGRDACLAAALALAALVVLLAFVGPVRLRQRLRQGRRQQHLRAGLAAGGVRRLAGGQLPPRRRRRRADGRARRRARRRRPAGGRSSGGCGAGRAGGADRRSRPGLLLYLHLDPVQRRLLAGEGADDRARRW